MHRLQELENDPVARAYVDKLASVLQASDPKWDGVWEMLHK